MNARSLPLHATASDQIAATPDPTDACADIEASVVLDNIRSRCQAAVTATPNERGGIHWWATLELNDISGSAEEFDSDLAWTLGWLAFYGLSARGKPYVTKYFSGLLALLAEKQAEE